MYYRLSHQFIPGASFYGWWEYSGLRCGIAL